MGFKKSSNRSWVLGYGLLAILLAFGITACGGGGSSSGGGTSTPTTSTPAPTITVTASSLSVNPGAPVTFTWTSSNATKVELTESVYTTSVSMQSTGLTGVLEGNSCTLYADPNHVHETVTGDELQVTSDLTAQETLATSGSVTKYPSKSTTYTFTVTGNGGSTPKSITIAAETIAQKDAWVRLYNAWAPAPWNYTSRWAYGYIEVYDGTNSPVFQEALDAWNEILKGFVTLKKSTNPNSQITINASVNIFNNMAGQASWESDGSTTGKGTILVHPNYVNNKSTYLHELGHVLGFYIHTTEPGLMNGTVQSAQITPQVIGTMTRLYELPIKTYMP